MDYKLKPLSCLLLVIVLVWGFSFQAAYGINVQAPYAPEFTVEVFDSSYYVPPSYTINQYTGKNVTKQGYIVENISIFVKVKNQPFATFVNGTRYYMAYNPAYKGHFGEEWKSLEFNRECTMKSYLADDFPRQSDSEYTVAWVCSSGYFLNNTQLDIKVQAYIGHEAVIHVIEYSPYSSFPVYMGEHDEDGIIFDTAGEWSDIQTITITQNPHPPEQTIPEYPTWTILPIFIITTATGIITKKSLNKLHKRVD